MAYQKYTTANTDAVFVQIGNNLTIEHQNKNVKLFWFGLVWFGLVLELLYTSTSKEEHADSRRKCCDLEEYQLANKEEMVGSETYCYIITKAIHPTKNRC